MTTSRKPLHVCHVAYSFYESDNRVMRYAESLAARGDNVDVIGLRRPGAPKRSSRKGVQVLGVQARARNERAAWVYLAKILWFFVQVFILLALRTARRPYDVVHVHNIPDFLVFTALLPKLRGARVILDIHDVVPELYAGKFGTSNNSSLVRTLLALERLSCAFAHHVIVANHLWLATVAIRSAQTQKCTALLNYPDLELFRQRSALPSRGGDFVFLYPGTLNHHQGLDLAIIAFAQAAPVMPGAELHIYGDGPALPMLRQLSLDLGVQARVRFMARVPLTAVPEVISKASVGVVPKRADGFGNEAFSTKILEFMASGVPVIVSRTRIDAHYFGEDVVRFFTPGDADDLARQLRWAFASQEALRQMSDRASQLASAFGWNQHVSKYIAIVDGSAPASDSSAPLVAPSGDTHAAG